VLDFEKNYISTNLHCFHTLHVNAALKQRNVHLLKAFFRRTVWLTDGSGIHTVA
jgi:hypothetical protein